MKLIKSVLVFLSLMTSTFAFGAWDMFQTYVVYDVGGGNLYRTGNIDCDNVHPFFDGQYLGRFQSTSETLVLKGGEIKTWKNGASDVCGGRLYYRVYLLGTSPGAFSQVALTTVTNLGGGDQRWENVVNNISLLSGLTDAGTYVVEVYWSAWGGDSGPCDYYKFASATANADGCGTNSTFNDSNINFVPPATMRAYFEFKTTDSFADANFTASPVWGNDPTEFAVFNNSDAAGLIGTETTRSHTVRLNASGAGTRSITTSIATWQAQQEWYFWTGRRNQAATASNRTFIYLYSNSANPTLGTSDGYRIAIGDDSGDDEIRLERIDNGVATTIFQSVQTITNGIVDWGLTFRVVRTESGRWYVYTSTLPTITGSGATAWSNPAALSTVQLNNSLNGQLYADDNTYVPGAPGWIGLGSTHTGGVDAVVGQEWDNFRLITLPPDTYINLTAASATIDENLGGGTYTITVAINNPSATVATTADLVLTSGDGTRIGGFSSQTVTFPAGSSSNQNVVLTITDNNLCDDIANLNFTLQNVSGGQNAYIVAPSTFALTIVDDNTGYSTILSDDFEDGNLNGWTPVAGGTFSASNSAPATGVYSMRHVYTGAAGQAHVYYDADNASLPGVNTTWRFNLKTFNREPSPANKWLIFLAANDNNLWGTSVDGYAVGVNPVISGDPDILTLWRVDNGVPTVAIVSSAIAPTSDWGTTLNEVGFEVLRDENGLWTLRVDTNGDWDNLVTIGSGTETTYPDLGYYGARFIHTASIGGEFSLDDVSITQKGCKQIYYSRLSGNFTDPIWSSQPVGLPAPGTINGGRWTRLVVQTTHTVALNTSAVCDDITIDAGATVTGGTASLKVYGDWINSGTFTAGTSTITLKGTEAQSVLGASTTRFHNLTIDNDFGTVTLLTATEATGVVAPEEGTLQTGGLLTLISNATTSGSIGQIKAGSDVSGNVTLQRYIPTGTAGWVFLACPIPGQTIGGVGNGIPGGADNGAWDDDLTTSGFTGSDYPPPYSFNNVQYYNEAAAGGRNVGWVPASNTTDALLAQRGYNVYMTSASNTVDVTGTIQKGSVAVSLPFTNTGNSADGWNLVCNVYPSEVDWVAVEGNSSDVAVYYVFDSALPGYRTYNANSLGGSASRYIAHSQAFFTKATTNAPAQSLSFLESHKTATNAAFERDEPESQVLRLRIEREGQADEALIMFVDGATDNFEQIYDAEKFESPVPTSPEFALMSADGIQLTLDARPLLTQSLSIPVYLDLPAAGDYTFIIDEVQNIALGSCIVVEDLFTGTSIPVEQGSELLISTDEAYQGNRLLIHFGAPLTVSTTDAACIDADGEITISSTAGSWTVSVEDAMGNTMFGGNGNFELAAPAGDYTIVMSNAETICQAAEYVVTIEEPLAITSWMETTPSACGTIATGSILFGLENAGEYTYSIVNGLNEVVFSGTTSDAALYFENVPGDVYTVTISNNCETISFEANTKDPNLVNAEIVPSATTAEMVQGASVDVSFYADAQNATEYTWEVQGTVVSSEASYTHTFNAAGTYLITLHAQNESCSDEAEVEVIINEVVGVADVIEQEAISMAQVNGGVMLTFNTVNARRADVRVLNTLGQIVLNERAASSDGQQFFVDLNAYATGPYTIQVIAGGEVVFTTQIVK